jgi:hypothetical protein
MLVGSLICHHLLLRDSGPCYMVVFVMCVITVAMVWLSFPVEGFWSSCDNWLIARQK